MIDLGKGDVEPRVERGRRLEDPESSGAFTGPPWPGMLAAYVVCLVTTVTGTLIGQTYTAIARVDHDVTGSSWSGGLIGAGAGAGLGVALTVVTWLGARWRRRARTIQDDAARPHL
jgi:hypothetical protein